MLLGSCGAASTAFQDQFIQQIHANLPGGNTSKPAGSTSTGSTTPSASQTKTDVSVAQMLSMHNQLRSSLGLTQFKMNSTLTLIAQRQAAYNSSIGTIAHADANGGQCWDRATAAGYNWTTIGENLAFSTNPQHVYNLWVNSPGHYHNMVNPLFIEIGIGKVTAGGGEYWCTVFAHPK
jgi:uncharacterized protein YkwD